MRNNLRIERKRRLAQIAYDPAARPKSVPVSSGLTMAWRGDGLRGWKQNGSNPKLYYLYDGDLPICELDPTGAVVNSYGYGPLGLVQCFYNQNSSVGYILYTFDPFGNLVQRIRQHDLYPADTAVYESTGMLHSDLDLLTSGMTAYPAIDPIGPLTQGGDFTDEETKGGGTTSGLVLEGDTFYDPLTRKPVARLEKPDTVLHGYEPFPHARLLGDILAGGLGGRFGGNAGAAAGVGTFEGLYHYAEGNSAEDSIAYGANVEATSFVVGEALGFAGRAIARTPLGQAVGGYARRAVGSALGRLGFGEAVPASVILTGTDTNLGAAAARVKPLPGYTDVVVHGTPGDFQVKRGIEWLSISHRSLAAFIRRSGFTGGKVRLIACGTGCPGGVAQDLANKLGVEVLAPSDTAWIFLRSGRITIGPDQWTNSGAWVPFIPGRR